MSARPTRSMTRMIPRASTGTLDERALPAPGDVLGGKYRIEREIGRGGMGVVYEVTHVVMTHSRFAIKWLVAPNDGDSEAIRRFRREARTCGAIRHPNVVEVYDVNLEDSGSYMVMELLQGESLAQRLERTGALEVREACRIVRAAAEGVAAAHARGVVHRDLKPANIFLCHSDAPAPPLPKVVDFGISRVIAASDAQDTTETRRGTRIGTPLYMAPEQMRAQECDQRTDVYALGVTLYEAISGKRAFAADTEAELVYKVLAGEVAELDEVVPGLPAGLSAVVMRAMALAPEQRHPSALQLSAALAEYETGRERPVLPLPSRRRRGAWLAAAALSGGGALGLWWLAPRLQPAPAAPQTMVAPATRQPESDVPPLAPASGPSTASPERAAPDAGKPQPSLPSRSEPAQHNDPDARIPAPTAAAGTRSRTSGKRPVTPPPEPARAAEAPPISAPPPAPAREPERPAKQPKPVVRIDSL